MYYIKYNGINLTELVKVRGITIPSFPSISHDSIEMWDMDGNIFNSLSYGNRNIELILLIWPDNPNNLDVYVNDVKQAFFTREPKPLFIENESRYLLAIPDGEITIEEKGVGCCEMTVNLIAYYPYWIDVEVSKSATSNKELEVINDGDTNTTPVIRMFINNDTTFCQLENSTTAEKILVGRVPTKDKPNTVKANQYIIKDECTSISGWTQSSSGIDTGCGTGGTIGISSDGGSITIGEWGSSSATWKGASYRKNLGKSVTDFKVTAVFNFNSAGVNGDPTNIKYLDDNAMNWTGGTVREYYMVSGDESAPVRSERSGNDTVYRTIPVGNRLYNVNKYPDAGLAYYPGTEGGGWLKVRVHYETETGYIDGFMKLSNLEKVVEDTRYSDTICNFVTNTRTALRKTPNEFGDMHYMLEPGTVVRCFMEEKSTPSQSTVFYPVQCVDGVTYSSYWSIGNTNTNSSRAYVDISTLTRASEMAVDRTPDVETADDCTGKIQLYGFSSSGVQLFSMSLIDESEWYEATYPLIRKNSKDFLYDVKYTDLLPDKKKVVDKNTIKYENVLSGETGNWNNFFGQLYIERINNVWKAYVKNLRTGKIISTNSINDTTNNDQALSYLVLYIGAADTNKPSSMALDYLSVQSASEIDTTTNNIQYFQKGDIIEIDCGVPCVKVNGIERADLVDIGSQFFDLETGSNIIKLVTDDNGAAFEVEYNKKYL